MINLKRIVKFLQFSKYSATGKHQKGRSLNQCPGEREIMHFYLKFSLKHSMK